MYFNIKKAVYVSEYTINLIFENGKEGTVDLKEYKGDGVFSKFSDMDYFKKFYIEDRTLTWGKGELDIAPETLYLKATGEKKILWDTEELSSAR